MKKRIMAIAGIILLASMLAACSGTAQSTASSSSASTAATPAAGGGENSRNLEFSKMTLPEKLAIGTLKLEGTDLAIDAKEAALLLPLWKAVNALRTSQTISTKEMDALYSQIEGAMTPEQVKEIEGMSLTGDDIRGMMTDLGLDFGPGGQGAEGAQGSSGSGTNRSPGQSDGGPGMMQGGPDGGMPPNGGMGGPGGFDQGNSNRSAQLTPDANQVPRRQGGGMGMMFIQPLIELLQQRAGL
jgi:hypothetical protein